MIGAPCVDEYEDEAGNGPSQDLAVARTAQHLRLVEPTAASGQYSWPPMGKSILCLIAADTAVSDVALLPGKRGSY
jgi:hypothetical protein